MRLLRRVAAALTLLSGAAHAENNSFIEQVGDSNRVWIDQAPATSNSATAYQAGSANHAEVRQMGGPATHVSLITQIGSRNVAVVEHFGSGGAATGTITQTGDGNYAAIAQSSNAISTALVGIAGDQNDVNITQRNVGGANFASAIASGNANDLRILQDGSDNFSVSFAAGNGNYIGVEQFGNSTSEVTIQGNGNRTRIWQR
jgi:Curlin associated repeat